MRRSLEESRLRVSNANANLQLEKDKAKARDGLDRLEELSSFAHGGDAGMRQYVQAVQGLERSAQSVAGIAGRPSREILRSALWRSLLAHLQAVRNLFPELPATLPPNERYPLAHWSDGWIRAIKPSLEAIIEGQPVPAIDDETEAA